MSKQNQELLTLYPIISVDIANKIDVIPKMEIEIYVEPRRESGKGNRKRKFKGGLILVPSSAALSLFANVAYLPESRAPALSLDSTRFYLA